MQPYSQAHLVHLHRLTQRIEFLLPGQYRAVGPLVLDQLESIWFNLFDPYALLSLALNLLRIQRGPRLLQTGQPRRVCLVVVGEWSYLEADDVQYPISFPEEEASLLPTELRLLEGVISLLEAERRDDEE